MSCLSWRHRPQACQACQACLCRSHLHNVSQQSQMIQKALLVLEQLPFNMKTCTFKHLHCSLMLCSQEHSKHVYPHASGAARSACKGRPACASQCRGDGTYHCRLSSRGGNEDRGRMHARLAAHKVHICCECMSPPHCQNGSGTDCQGSILHTSHVRKASKCHNCMLVHAHKAAHQHNMPCICTATVLQSEWSSTHQECSSVTCKREP